MFLVVVKSYRDDSVSMETLRRLGRVFSDFFDAEIYQSELEKDCGGWVTTEIIEIQEG